MLLLAFMTVAKITHHIILFGGYKSQCQNKPLIACLPFCMFSQRFPAGVCVSEADW